MRRPTSPVAFTLVELLVVVAIIVVLLALLAPALDLAVYQAELATCATRQRLIAGGATQYAMEHNRHYPPRDSVPIGFWRRPNLMRFKDQADDLAPTRPYIPLPAWLDPLNNGLKPSDIDRAVDLNADTSVFTNYMVWYGWRYSVAPGGAASNRIGQGFEWNGVRYSLLVSEDDLMNPWSRVENSHPGKNGSGQMVILRNTPTNFADANTGRAGQEKETLSRWVSVGRNMVDSHFTGQDLAVTRLTDVDPEDERLDRLPFDTNHGSNWPAAGQYTLVTP